MYNMFEDLENHVIDWGNRKGILGDIFEHTDLVERRSKQLLKFSEESQEMVKEIHEGDVDRVRDEMGDVLVTLAIQANLWGLSLTECLEEAYNKINVRTGRMVDGVFVKDE
jgi:NTP pyrophosphatase (non-canonical NTP hydrolase)